jgi:DNA-binding NtrC family response regulator
VGSSKTIRVDVRVIAATNQIMEEAIAERRFREDLYYRLNVIPIEVPPLRSRRDDIPLLIAHFLSISNENRDHPSPGFTEEALESMCNLHWPGNVRELENLVERLVTLSGGAEITQKDLPATLRTARTAIPSAPEIPPHGLSFREVVDQFESDLILQALKITHGNKNRAAQLIQMNRTTMLEKMKKKGVKFESLSSD